MGKSQVLSGEMGNTEEDTARGENAKAVYEGKDFFFLCMEMYFYEQEACYRSNPQM